MNVKLFLHAMKERPYQVKQSGNQIACRLSAGYLLNKGGYGGYMRLHLVLQGVPEGLVSEYKEQYGVKVKIVLTKVKIFYLCPR